MQFMEFSKKLQKLRKQNNLTQEAFGALLGLSPQAVSKWENGMSDPSTSNLLALAKLYEVSVEEILKKMK